MARNQLNIENSTIQNFHNYINANEETPIENISLNWLRASSCFKGREGTLNEIYKLFETKQIVVIHGGPGIGKTETARHFAETHSEYFKGNLSWVYAETQQNIQKCFDELSATLELKSKDVSQVFGKFKNSRCLVIFDNAESMAAIRSFLPSSQLHPTVKVLITSQFGDWDVSFGKVPLEALELEDALDILRHKLGAKVDSSKLWEDLVHRLEGIPLSIRIVSCLLYKKLQFPKFQLHEFIDSLSSGNFIHLKFPKSEQDHYKESVLSSIYVAIDRLKNEEMEETSEQMHSSIDVLCFIAYLDADEIYPKNLLLVPSINQSKDMLQEALNKLKDYSLIQFDSQEYDYTIKVHRTIQLVLRKYDLNELNGFFLKALIKLMVLGDNLLLHVYSIFKYVNMEEYQEVAIEFYNEINKNETLIDSYFIYLVECNCDNILRKLLPKFKNEFYKTDDYNNLLNNLLFRAICNKNTDMRTIDLLINYGAKIEYSSGENKDNGFHVASYRLSIELFDRLLESNDSKNIINCKDNCGRTTLHLLVKMSENNNISEVIECMDHLISKWNADISIQDYILNNILHTACDNQNSCLEMIKYLVEKCNCKDFVNSQNEYGNTPLHLIFTYKYSYSDVFEIASYLVNECEADITIQNNDGLNTLFCLCRFGTSEIIDFVLRSLNYREIINLKDEDGDVAFTYLIFNKQTKEDEKIELMKLFIENDMDFKIRNKWNETLSEIAKEEKCMKLSNELKRQENASPNKQNKMTMT